jgi:hypothetical protein
MIENITSPIVAAAYVLTGIAYSIILTRLVLRGIGRESFTPDDIVMIGAMFIYGMETATYSIIVRQNPQTTQSS